MARTADRHEIPERIAEAGLELFLRQGYNATGIQQIANAAGVPKGSFYNYFTSKEKFAAQIIDRYAEQSNYNWQSIMKTAPASPLAKICYLFEQMIAHYQKANNRHGCLIGNFAAEIASSSESCRQRLIAAQNTWRHGLAELIQQGQKAGEIRQGLDARELSSLTWNVWEGSLLQMKTEQSLQPLRDNIFLLIDQMYRPK